MALRSPEQKRVLARRIFRYTVLALLIVWPWYGNPYVLLGDANVTLVFVMIAGSLVLLTGWVGQISLAQASFVGIGAFSTALLAQHASVGFPISLLVGGATAAGAALVLGAVALRVRGLYLAVATLIFAWICDSYLFLLPSLGGGGSVQVPGVEVGTRGTFPYFDFTNRRTFYYVGLGVAALVLFALANLRDSKTGRALRAVRGSEVAAASLAINVTRYKLLAFGISGFAAGMAGSLIATYQGALSATQFRFTASFFYLAIPVVGGLQSLTGSVAAAILFGLLSDLFFRVEALNGYLDLVSGLLLVGVLLAYPGGLAAASTQLGVLVGRWRPGGLLPSRSRPRWAAVRSVATAIGPMGRRVIAPMLFFGNRQERRERAADERPEPPAESEFLPLAALGVGAPSTPAALAAVDSIPPAPRRSPYEYPVDRRTGGGDRAARRELVAARGVTVRFGGLTAVNEVSLSVREGEIVGLIGPNGAGKTTLFNAIAGLVRPTAGSVELFGTDATEKSVHARAAMGVARTFQAIQLLPEQTVFENLMVATHLQNTTGFLSHIAITARAVVSEKRARALVGRVIDLLELNDVAHRPVSGLPFGTLRMVEVARGLVTRSSMLMLDEPASGLDNAETERLSRLLFYLRAELGITILLIEHDVHMVTSVCDHIYVIDRGNLIAEGPTEQVQRDQRVIAAYLGDAAVAPQPAGAAV